MLRHRGGVYQLVCKTLKRRAAASELNEVRAAQVQGARNSPIGASSISGSTIGVRTIFAGKVATQSGVGIAIDMSNVQKDICVNSFGRGHFFVRVVTISIFRENTSEMISIRRTSLASLRRTVTSRITRGSVRSTSCGLTVFEVAQLPLEIDVVQVGLVTSHSSWRLRERSSRAPTRR
mmetsp:Transcript_98243/g.264063  ORF Transcript_98243/g.264063 Transcript_98243/m.264063 type:complete len:178 (+) Transcript_98243:412-945(+)